MITTAAAEHLEGIRALWQQAFGDTTAYIDLFLQRRAKLSDTLVYLQGDSVCGMLFMLPCRLVFGAAAFRCAYLYGVATSVECRGQGISTELLRHAYELCGRRGYDVCALEPATAQLFDFYAKRGYATQGYARVLSVRAEQADGISIAASFCDVSSAEIVKMRRAAFGSTMPSAEQDAAYLEWDEEAVAYAMLETKQIGGSFYQFDIGGEAGYLCCQPDADRLIIKEFVGNIAQLYAVMAGLHGIYQKQEYIFRLSNTAERGELTTLAMTRWVGKGRDEPFYLSLLLD